MLFYLLDHSQLPLVTDILYLRVKVLFLAFGANYSKGTFRKTTQGRLLCIVFIVFAVPLFAILLQFISLYINENLNALTDVVSFKLSRFRETWPVRFLEKISGPNELKSTVRKLIKVTQNYKRHHHRASSGCLFYIRLWNISRHSRIRFPSSRRLVLHRRRLLCNCFPYQNRLW